jgi:hypothetical protein
MKAGTTATAEQVFGTRLAGVRVVRVADPDPVRDASGRSVGVGHLEDGGAPVPAAAIEQAICQSGTVTVTVDGSGNPLDVGRDQRLFTPRQRIALALRDGGCLWPGCDRPASYSEAHHIDPWNEGGRTDVDRGILVCRFHHMNLHHHGWRIRREGTRELTLHPPVGGTPTALRSRSPLRWLWPRTPHGADPLGACTVTGRRRPPPTVRTTPRAAGRANAAP